MNPTLTGQGNGKQGKPHLTASQTFNMTDFVPDKEQMSRRTMTVASLHHVCDLYYFPTSGNNLGLSNQPIYLLRNIHSQYPKSFSLNFLKAEIDNL